MSPSKAPGRSRAVGDNQAASCCREIARCRITKARPSSSTIKRKSFGPPRSRCAVITFYLPPPGEREVSRGGAGRSMYVRCAACQGFSVPALVANRTGSDFAIRTPGPPRPGQVIFIINPSGLFTARSGPCIACSIKENQCMSIENIAAQALAERIEAMNAYSGVTDVGAQGGIASWGCRCQRQTDT